MTCRRRRSSSSPSPSINYFISDLHLPPGPSRLREVFWRFLAGPAREARALYILGDLFEYWIGDDVGLAAYAEETRALAELTRSGVRVYFQHGNRDFLVGQKFSTATGVHLLSDPHVADVAGQPTLLSHGDLLCTDDVRYQRWRRVARNPVFQAVYGALPVALRERIAGGVRRTMTADMRSKPQRIMDVNDTAVRRAFQEHAVSRLIHGHTHRPAEHRYEVSGRHCERVVLADWRPERCEALRVDASVDRVLLR